MPRKALQLQAQTQGQKASCGKQLYQNVAKEGPTSAMAHIAQPVARQVSDMTKFGLPQWASYTSTSHLIQSTHKNEGSKRCWRTEAEVRLALLPDPGPSIGSNFWTHRCRMSIQYWLGFGILYRERERERERGSTVPPSTRAG